jgi:hypothetical protein
MYTKATRNDVKQFAQKIEALAKEVQVNIDNGCEFISVANELVRNNSTFVFTIGEVYALEQVGASKSVKAKVVATSANHNYHNVRDSRGRFLKV